MKKHAISLDEIGYGACRSVDEFEKVKRLGEGTYGVVYEGIDKKSKERVALKKIRVEKEIDPLSLATFREIHTLMKAKHRNIVKLKEMAVGRSIGKIYLVMEFCQQDLGNLMDHMKLPFTEPQIKCLVLQLFEGLKYLHERFIIHRDLKVSNLLLTDEGILKIADFGLTRGFGEPAMKMTPRVVTLWYRPPELLFGDERQTPALDMWAAGCILGELIKHEPLLPGKDEIHQIRLIVNLLGTPNKTIWPDMKELEFELKEQSFNRLRSVFPNLSEECLALLKRLLAYDPKRRISAVECMNHEYFSKPPHACEPSLMPSLKSLTRSSRTRSSTIDLDFEV
uniref:Protein kinase domain-containing protein n=1 Tax=Acrobeloides nanus TaxID=290746 RepID=A0A914DIL1_9BILA